MAIRMTSEVQIQPRDQKDMSIKPKPMPASSSASSESIMVGQDAADTSSMAFHAPGVAFLFELEGHEHRGAMPQQEEEPGEHVNVANDLK